MRQAENADELGDAEGHGDLLDDFVVSACHAGEGGQQSSVAGVPAHGTEDEDEALSDWFDEEDERSKFCGVPSILIYLTYICRPVFSAVMTRDRLSNVVKSYQLISLQCNPTAGLQKAAGPITAGNMKK